MTSAIDDGEVAIGGEIFDVIARVTDEIGEEFTLLRDEHRLALFLLIFCIRNA